MFSDLRLCAGRFKKNKKKIEDVKLLGLEARGFGGYSGGRVRKKQNLWGGTQKTEILGGTKILVGMEKNYFLSMLPFVGRSPYSRGLLLLIGEETEQSVGERRGFLICKTVCADKCDCVTSFYQVFHYTSIYILRQLTLPCFRTFSNFTQGDRIPILRAFSYIIYNKKQYRYAHRYMI